MKKTITIILICSSIFATAQKKDSTGTKMQTTLGSLTEAIDTVGYTLTGTVPAFKMLLKAVNNPGDLSRDEITSLNAWIIASRPITTKKDKPKQ